MKTILSLLVIITLAVIPISLFFAIIQTKKLNFRKANYRKGTIIFSEGGYV